jgi:hypothetical protein
MGNGMTTQIDDRRAPEWFGAAARSVSFFPVMMSVYALVYAVWWPFAWGLPGAIAFAAVVLFATAFIARGVRQIRHALRFVAVESPEGARIGRAMGILNSVTHPIWMLGMIALIVVGEQRWIVPLVVFVIGAHFLPMARILGRRIDYPLGLLMVAFAVAGGVLAADPSVPWLTVFAVAGVGGTLATGVYAVYMARAYGRMVRAAGVPYP